MDYDSCFPDCVAHMQFLHGHSGALVVGANQRWQAPVKVGHESRHKRAGYRLRFFSPSSARYELTRPVALGYGGAPYGQRSFDERERVPASLAREDRRKEVRCARADPFCSVAIFGSRAGRVGGREDQGPPSSASEVRQQSAVRSGKQKEHSSSSTTVDWSTSPSDSLHSLPIPSHPICLPQTEEQRMKNAVLKTGPVGDEQHPKDGMRAKSAISWRPIFYRQGRGR